MDENLQHRQLAVIPLQTVLLSVSLSTTVIGKMTTFLTMIHVSEIRLK